MENVNVVIVVFVGMGLLFLILYCFLCQDCVCYINEDAAPKRPKYNTSIVATSSRHAPLGQSYSQPVRCREQETYRGVRAASMYASVRPSAPIVPNPPYPLEDTMPVIPQIPSGNPIPSGNLNPPYPLEHKMPVIPQIPSGNPIPSGSGTPIHSGNPFPGPGRDRPIGFADVAVQSTPPYPLDNPNHPIAYQDVPLRNSETLPVDPRAAGPPSYADVISNMLFYQK